MAGGRLMQRVDALEHQSGAGFAGFACIDIWPGETVDQAKADWERSNGPVGNRRWMTWDYRETNNAPA